MKFFVAVVVVLLPLCYLAWRRMGSEESNVKTDFYKELVRTSESLSIDDVKFIDQSFVTHGRVEKSSFGDFSIGLYRLSDEAYFKLSKSPNGNFLVELYGKSGAWVFQVEIDRESGAWINPAQFEGVSDEPPPDDHGDK